MFLACAKNLLAITCAYVTQNEEHDFCNMTLDCMSELYVMNNCVWKMQFSIEKSVLIVGVLYWWHELHCKKCV